MRRLFISPSPHLFPSRASGLHLLVPSTTRFFATKRRRQGAKKTEESEVKSNVPKNNVEDPQLLNARLDAFATRIGITWRNKDLLLQALTHTSFSHDKTSSNEALEYFGDRTLNFLVCEHLINKYPQLSARALSDATKVMSNNQTLTSAGRRLGLQDFVRWTPSTEDSTGEETIISNTMEALIASLYKDQGLKAAREFVVKCVLPPDEHLDIIPFLREKLPRNTLAELLTRRGSGSPYYVILQESGRLTKDPAFLVGVYSESKLLGQGSGSSIVKAESAAAQDALNKIWGERAYLKLPRNEY